MVENVKRAVHDTRRFGVWIALVGAASQMVGIGVDAWLHAHDPALAEREGVFSLKNPGHALLIVGMALVVVGVLLALFGPRLYRPRPFRSRRLQLAQWGAPVGLVVLLAGCTAAGASSPMAKGHHGSQAHAGTAAHQHAGLPVGAQVIPGVHHHGNGVILPDRPLEPPTRAQLADQLVKSREAAMQYATVADALADGYHEVTPYVPLIGAHYMKFSIVDGTFDVGHPEMLLYDGTSLDSRIVGLSYYVRGAYTQPQGFAGPNDHWHQHIGLCVDPSRVLVIGAESTTPEQCRAMGGVKVPGNDAWMVHAWVVPSWESPQGVFSAENPDLR